MPISDTDAAHMITSLDGILETIKEVKNNIAEIDRKFDRASVTIARHGERINNNKNLTERLTIEMKDALNIIHDEIRDNKSEAIIESVRAMKNWAYGSLGMGVVSLIGAIGAIVAIISKIN